MRQLDTTYHSGMAGYLMDYPRGVIGGEEPPERNVKKLRLLSLKAVVFFVFYVGGIC